MPRVGGEFVPLFDPVESDTTIESAVHNGIVADFVTDANTARPITAGGTGAVSATAARTNLGTEVTMQAVTNFDSHVWETGSFVAVAGATGAPTPGDNYFGFTYGDTSNRFVEARNLTTGVLYLRRKLGTWGAWIAEGTDYVNVIGDTMTGTLTVPTVSLNATNYCVSDGTNLIFRTNGIALIQNTIGNPNFLSVATPEAANPAHITYAASKGYVDGVTMTTMDVINALTARLEVLERKIK